MNQVLLIAAVALLLGMYLRGKPRMAQVGPFLPDSLLFGIGLYTLGAVIVWLLDPGPGSRIISSMSLIALASAVLGGIAFSLVCGDYYRKVNFLGQFAETDSGPIEKRSLWTMLLLSSLVCLVFVYAVFSNSIVAALLSIASITSESTFLDARKAITAGSEGYFAPGYVKQFRDILIPISIIAIMAVVPGYSRSRLVWLAFSAAFVAMIVSGQRLVFVVFFAALILGVYYTRRFADRNPNSNSAIGWGIYLAIVTLLGLYVGLTVLLGRADTEVSFLALLADTALNLGDRILLAAPRENVLTYPVWVTIGPTGGASWVADLSAVLPGVEESLANVLHASTGGSYQGNSPLGLPPDVWLAWGWWGVATVPALYVFAIGLFDMLLLTNRSALFFGVKIYLFVVLPICYSPYLFILYGGAVALLLILFVATLRSRFWWSASKVEA